MMQIALADLDDPAVLELLRTQVRLARAATAGIAHALDELALRAADIELWTIRDGNALLAAGALQALASQHGEIKSMYTVSAARERGVGTAMLGHIIAAARAHGMLRVSLETGSGNYYVAARVLYRRHGFSECPPFADYVADVNSAFMSPNLPRA